MKFLIVIAFIAFVSSAIADYPKEPEEEFNQVISACLKEIKLTDEEYTDLRLGKVTEPTENMQCMAHCFMEKTGVMKDGKLQEEVATQILLQKKNDAEKTKKIMETCRGETGKDNCEKAYNIHKCFLANKAY